MNASLLDENELRAGFNYSPELSRLLDLGLTFFDPRLILVDESLRTRHEGLRQRYPDRVLVPFARRDENDDVACWEITEGRQTVVIVHDFASPGWERRQEFADFRAWFHSAVQDMFEFEGG